MLIMGGSLYTLLVTTAALGECTATIQFQVDLLILTLFLPIQTILCNGSKVRNLYEMCYFNNDDCINVYVNFQYQIGIF